MCRKVQKNEVKMSCEAHSTELKGTIKIRSKNEQSRFYYYHFGRAVTRSSF